MKEIVGEKETESALIYTELCMCVCVQSGIKKVPFSFVPNMSPVFFFNFPPIPWRIITVI